MSQSEQTQDELLAEAKRQNDVVFELDKQAKILHNWIDRGLKLSCEDAGHPQHEVWKKRNKL